MSENAITTTNVINKPFILDFFGWEIVKPKIEDIFSQEKKFIIAFPHSSLIDAVIASFYTTSDPYIKKYSYRFKTLMNKNNLDGIFGPIFKYYLGAIPVDKKSSGNLANIKKELEKTDDYILLLSPKGTTYNKPWRTGWYYIAKELNLPILVVGVDYHKHTIKFANHFIQIKDKTPEEVILEMMENMKYISNKHLSTENYETFAIERGSFFKSENEKSLIYMSIVILIVVFIAALQKN